MSAAAIAVTDHTDTKSTSPAGAPSLAQAKLTVRVESFKPIRSNTLVGFITVVIPELHLRIVDLPVHEKNESRWIGLPAKPQVNRDGTVRRDERGRVAYSTVLEFTDRPTREAFSARVVAALIAFAPEAFDGEAA